MLFPKDGEILSHVSNIKHKINTTDDIPIYSRQYRYPYVYKKEIDDQVEDRLKKRYNKRKLLAVELSNLDRATGNGRFK